MCCIYAYVARWARATCLLAVAGPEPLRGCMTCPAPLPPLRTTVVQVVVVLIVVLVVVQVMLVGMIVYIISVCRPGWASNV